MTNSHVSKENKWFYFIQVVFDLVWVNLGFYIGFMIRFRGSNFVDYLQPYTELIPWISLITLIFFQVYGVFKCGDKSLLETIYSAFLSLIFIDIVTMALTFFNRGFSFPRSIFAIAFVLQFVFLIVWKSIIIKIYNRLNKPKSAIIIGHKEEAEEIARKLMSTSLRAFEIKYICGEVDVNINKMIEGVESVIIGPKLDGKVKQSIISYCIGAGKIVFIVPELFEIALFNAKLTQFDDVPAFCIENLQLSLEQRIVKRIFDLVVAIIGIVLSSPIMLLAYLGIKIYDRGPAIFAQERVTRGNKIFKLYKFRTMVVNAEKHTGPVLATDKDPRITRLGALMRSTRIDELPQLFNVLFGHMSVVGPRPERQYFIDQFKQYIPDFGYRLAVKAGVTGLAQVLGKYTTTPEDKLRYDLLYIRNYSFLLDLRIVMQTIKTVFMKTSSQGFAEQKTFDELAKSMNYNVYKELGVTRIEQNF